MTRRWGPSYTNTRVKRSPTIFPVHQFYAGIDAMLVGHCCQHTASEHMVTFTAKGSRSFKCLGYECRCTTWDDGWAARASAPSGQPDLRVINGGQ